MTRDIEIAQPELEAAINGMRSAGMKYRDVLTALAQAGTEVHKRQQTDTVRAAIISKDGLVLNVTLLGVDWDGSEGEWQPPEGTHVELDADAKLRIGGTYRDGVFTPAPEPDEAEEVRF